MIRQFIFALFVLGLFGCDGGPPTIDGYTYKTVKIGNQEWFAENLRTTVYVNGDPISYSRTQDSWATSDMGMRCSYRHEDIMNATHGQLYNWYAVNDERGLCPNGWRVPSDKDWQHLEVFLGIAEADVSLRYDRGSGELSIGNKLKAKSGWGNGKGTQGTDDFGFSAFPGGYRIDGFGPFPFKNGAFGGVGDHGYWWSSSQNGSSAWYRKLTYREAIVRDYFSQRVGCSIRCMRDSE